METNGKRKIYDPVRKKQVVLTPEEEVRQFVIRFLRQQCAIPLGYISCEVPIRVYRKDFRYDLAVRNRKGRAALLVECKRPSVPLEQAVWEQAMRYNLSLAERFVAITNGREFRCFERVQDASGRAAWREWPRFPSWQELNAEPGMDPETAPEE